MVHGYFCAELSAEVGGITDVIEISMGQNDQLELARQATRTFKLFFKVGALIGNPRVDQDIAGINFDEVTIDAP